MIKELIISGDAAFQIAFEKFEKGDNDAITQYCKTISARKGSVDLLENMDLDFAFEDKNSTEAFYATVSNTGTRIGVSSSASQRRPSIDTHIRSNSIFGISDTDQPLTAFNSSVFDDNDRHVELSAYAAMAKSLSSSKAAPIVILSNLCWEVYLNSIIIVWCTLRPRKPCEIDTIQYLYSVLRRDIGVQEQIADIVLSVSYSVLSSCHFWIIRKVDLREVAQ